MSAYSRVIARMVILFALIAGSVVLLKPVNAEAFACPGGPQCSTQYSSCLRACGTSTACKQAYRDDLAICCEGGFKTRSRM
jgi:hypothetical protein